MNRINWDAYSWPEKIITWLLLRLWRLVGIVLMAIEQAKKLFREAD